MRNKRMNWFFISLFAVIVLFFSFQKWDPSFSPAAEMLSQQEAKQLVEERYKGMVTNITFKEKKYMIELNKNEVRYEIKLDAQSGEVVSFSKIENVPEENKIKQDPTKLIEPTETESKPEIEPKPEIETETKSKTEIIPAKKPVTKITKEEAGQIALKEIKGTIDDIDLEDEDNHIYYLVEIDTLDQREAIVQIDAITGEILTISWDD